MAKNDDINKSKMSEDEQLVIIDQIRKGNNALRDEYIRKIYDRVVNYVLALELREEYREDAIQVGIEKAIQMIDSYDFRSIKTPISIAFYGNIHVAISDYFVKNLYFSGMIDGITYDNVFEYLTLKLGRRPKSKKVIKFLNEYGMSEKPLSHTSTGENEPEQALEDAEIMDNLSKAIGILTPKEQYIFLSFNGWLGYKPKSSLELASEFSCSTKNIYGIYANAIKKLGTYTPLAFLGNETHPRR